MSTTQHFAIFDFWQRGMVNGVGDQAQEHGMNFGIIEITENQSRFLLATSTVPISSIQTILTEETQDQ